MVYRLLPVLQALIRVIDIETTGTDPASDAIIDPYRINRRHIHNAVNQYAKKIVIVPTRERWNL